jgi:L-fucose isomerase-like protein
MQKTKIGFLPSNWEAWNGGNYAEKIRDRCIQVYKDIPGFELVVPSKNMTQIGCVSDLEDAKKVSRFFIEEEIAGLIIGNMDFGMEVAVGALLSSMRKDLPIIHFAARSAPYLPNGSRQTDTWCGQFMTTSAIKRRGFIFEHILTSDPEEEYFKEKMGAFARAVNAIARFKGARIGQLGTRPQLFESQNWNEQVLQKRFGQMVVPVDLDEVLTKIEGIDIESSEVRRLAAEIPELACVEENGEADLYNLARCELGFKMIAEELDLQAMAINCWTRVQERLGVSVCAIIGRLNEADMPTACEVDVYGAETMLAVHSAALGVAKPHFIDWTDLHPDRKNTWLAWHCGNAPSSAYAHNQNRKLTRNERMIQWCPTCHGAMEGRLKEGPVTCSRLVEYDGEFTFFYGTGEVVDVPPFVRGAYGWVEVADIEDWEMKMVESGVVHHGTLIHDDKVADALGLFCKFLGINAVRGK